MNPENYKSIRNKPKRNTSISKSKSRMLAKPTMAPATQTLRDNYKNRTEWVTKIIPKLKE